MFSMCNRYTSAAIAAAALLASAPVANADLYEISASGTLAEVNDFSAIGFGSLGSLSTGNAWTVAIVFDSTAAATSNSTYFSSYSGAIQSVSINVNGTSFSPTDHNAFLGYPSIAADKSALFAGGNSVSENLSFEFSLEFLNNIFGGILSNFPATFGEYEAADFALGTSSVFSLLFAEYDFSNDEYKEATASGRVAQYDVVNLSQLVPIPSAASLAFIGLAGIATRRRRQL
jgi:hypothetical protein